MTEDSHDGECRSEDGITTGLIDALITACRVLAQRDLTTPSAQAGLRDLRENTDARALLSGMTNTPPTFKRTAADDTQVTTDLFSRDQWQLRAFVRVTLDNGSEPPLHVRVGGAQRIKAEAGEHRDTHEHIGDLVKRAVIAALGREADERARLAQFGRRSSQ